jgi:hypothetical protein
MLQHARKIGRGSFQGDDEGVLLWRADADAGEVLGFAAMEICGTLHEVKHLGVMGAEFRGEHALKGVKVVGTGDGSAVTPGGVFAQIKGPSLEVVATPSRGQAGGVKIGILRIWSNETFKERRDDPMLGLAGDEVRVKRFDVAAVADQQCFASTRCHHALNAILAVLMKNCQCAKKQHRKQETGEP